MVSVTLSVDKTEITLGESVIFTATTDATSGQIIIFKRTNGGGQSIGGGLVKTYVLEYTPTTVGSTQYYASYGSNNSDYVTVTVSDAPAHDYALSFDESSYNTCNGSCTVSATLTDDNVGVSGETVTLTGTGSSLSATTDSNGVATFNLSNISEDKTLTVTFDEVSDTASLTYGLATLNGSLTCLGKRMASNLTAMGVTGVDYTDGLTTLADAILDITPTITGIEFDTSVSCASSESSVTQGTQITLTGVLEADYNDTTVVDVDLEGYLSGATVKIYNGNTLLGSAITDSNGAYSFNYTPQTVGTMSIIAVFDGTTYFDTCSSNSVSVEVLSSTTLTVTATKSILSYADSESSVITATLTTGGSGVSGETVTMKVYDSTQTTLLDTLSVTDNNDGTYSATYNSSGVGDVVILTECNLLQETYVIEDCTFDDSLTSTPKNNWIIDSGMSISSDSTGTTISGSTTKYMKLQVDLTNFEMEWDYISGSGVTPIGIQTWKGSSWICYGTYNNNESRYVFEGTSKVYKSTSLKQNATYKYSVNNGTHSWYVDDELIQSVSAKSGSGTFYIGFYVSANCTSQKLKNVKIKPL